MRIDLGDLVISGGIALFDILILKLCLEFISKTESITAIVFTCLVLIPSLLIMIFGLSVRIYNILRK